MRDLYLSKSDFQNFRKCPGFAWLAKHRPEIVAMYPELGQARRAADGVLVDLMARDRFPGGTVLGQSSLDPKSSWTETRSALSGESTCLYQATAITEDRFLARADILVKSGEQWRIVEVKSSTKPEVEHKEDVAYQMWVFERAGIPIVGASLLLVDNAYEYSGSLDSERFLREHDVTSDARKLQNMIDSEAGQAMRYLGLPEGEVECGCHYRTKGNRCSTFPHFHERLVRPGTIYELSRISSDKIGTMIDRGIVELADWPEDIPLTEPQSRQVGIHRTQVEVVQKQEIRDFLDMLEFPLWFLDYETASYAVPRYDKCRPYQQVAFQYSLHCQETPGSSLTRFAFLARSADPFPMAALGVQLCSDLGPNGSIVVWNAPFEKGVNKDLARQFADQGTFFNVLSERIVDLMEVVKRGYWAHPAFHGSASIKVVLPVAASGLSYDDLNIGDGDTATEQWLRACEPDTPLVERDQIFADLESYCTQDTLAMVRIYQYLLELVAEPDAM